MYTMNVYTIFLRARDHVHGSRSLIYHRCSRNPDRCSHVATHTQVRTRHRGNASRGICEVSFPQVTAIAAIRVKGIHTIVFSSYIDDVVVSLKRNAEVLDIERLSVYPGINGVG